MISRASLCSRPMPNSSRLLDLFDFFHQLPKLHDFWTALGTGVLVVFLEFFIIGIPVSQPRFQWSSRSWARDLKMQVGVHSIGSLCSLFPFALVVSTFNFRLHPSLTRLHPTPGFCRKAQLVLMAARTLEASRTLAKRRSAGRKRFLKT